MSRGVKASCFDMLLIFEKSIRGGTIQAAKRYAKANNEYMKDQYKQYETSTYLQYLYANNLYGLTLIQKLPTHGFSWEEKVKKGNKGCNLEVDMKYPKELHKKHNELPFLAA